VRPFKSLHLPLGILSTKEFNAECVEYDMKVGERVYLFSDGIVDLKDSEEKEFSLNGFADYLLKSDDSDEVFLHILEQEKLSFERNMSNIDDVTFVEIKMISEDVISNKHRLVQNSDLRGARDWSMSFEMFNQTIRDFNPIPLMLHITMEVPELRIFNNDVCMVLSELITNGIDHGLLGLDSQLKNSANGFQQYYNLRNERLNNLSGESLHISLRHLPDATGGVLVIRVVDTGEGFDFRAIDLDIPKASQMSGRGIPLLTRLCESIVYEGNGNAAEAVYRWEKTQDNNLL